jgi:uncharacterized RDD family membrane protein YckC
VYFKWINSFNIDRHPDFRASFVRQCMNEDPHPTEYETASVAQRVIAHGIDSVVVSAVIVAAGKVLNLESVGGILVFVLVLAVALGYRIFGDSYFEGHALGKRLVGIRVFDARHRRPCNHMQNAMRNCILFIPFMPLIELVLLCIDGQERWGDRLAQTYVMRDHALETPVHAPDRPLRLEGLETTLRHGSSSDAQQGEVG